MSISNIRLYTVRTRFSKLQKHNPDCNNKAYYNSYVHSEPIKRSAKGQIA